MFEFHEEAGGRILVVKLSGKLTQDDYKVFLPGIERLIRDHGKIRMLCQMHDFHGWTAGAFWEDFKFDLKHFAHIERVALVGERRWQHGMAVFFKPFTMAKVRYFDESESEQATEWILADLSNTFSKGTEHAVVSRKDVVQEASEESFPASDAPGY